MDGVANSAQVKWSNWSACESSFSLLLVPQQPGVFALAEEIVPAGDDGVAQAPARQGEENQPRQEKKYNIWCYPLDRAGSLSPGAPAPSRGSARH